MIFVRENTAAYWEGWQAVEQHRTCPFTDPKEREDWAKGFSDGVDEERGSKVWYKSKTLVVGMAMLLVGLLVGIYGIKTGDPTFTGFGAGTTGTSLVMTALRLITNTNVTLTSGGGQYTRPPFMAP